MRLISLKLRNFKGIKSFDFVPNGENISVFGKNATGKTSLLDAYLWLLTGKDSRGAANFEIKTLDDAGQALTGLDHEVEGVFVDDNGVMTTLGRLFKEKWVKARGAAKPEFQGHKTVYSIDGVPSSKSEFESAVNQHTQHLRLVSDVSYFNEQLHWQERRNILLEVCGDVSDADVIASDAALAALPEILGSHTLEAHKKVIAAEKARINKELEGLPARIDEVTLGLPDISKIEPLPGLQITLASLEERETKKREEKARIEAGGEAAEKKKRLAEIEAELLKLQNAADEVVAEQNTVSRRKVNEIIEGIEVIERYIHKYKLNVGDTSRQIETLETTMAQLRESHKEVSASEFSMDICPEVGQLCPLKDRDEEGLLAAQAIFNNAKAEQIASINQTGKDAKAEVEAKRAEIAEIEDKIASGISQVAGLEKKQADLEKTIKQPPDYATIPEDAALEKEKARVIAAIAKVAGKNSGSLDEVQAELDDLALQADTCRTHIAWHEQVAKGQKRIDVLKEDEERLSAEFERLSGELYLTELFTKAKVDMLEEKINSAFRHARFKMFNELVNGGIEDTCVTIYKGVSYPNLNNGSRTNIDLDCIRTFQAHYKVSAPVWVDNAESITKLIQMECQVISLVVAGDETLRIEKENQNG